MKKLIIALSSIAVVGIGGIFVASQVDDETEKPAEASVTATNEEDVIEIPKERTVEIPHNGVPWEYMNTDEISTLQDNGETVFLFSDADQLETYIMEISASEFKDDDPVDKPTIMKSVASYLNYFIADVEKVIPDKKEYIDKLREIESALNNTEYEKIPNIIEEAKTLRES